MGMKVVGALFCGKALNAVLPVGVLAAVVPVSARREFAV